MPSFADIANKKASEVEKPPLPPIGGYIMMIVNDPQIRAFSSDKGNFEAVDFAFQGVSHVDGEVDVDELDKFGGAKGVRVQHTIMTDTDDEAAFARAEYNLTRFMIETLGAGDDSMTITQLMANCKGKQAHVEVGHRPDKRPGREEDIYPDCKKVMPIS